MRLESPRIYRATTEAWLGQLLLPLIFFLVLTVTVIRLTGLNPWVASLGVLMLAIVACIDYMLPMLSNWLVLDDRMLEGSMDGRYLRVYWGDVLAAWLVERKRLLYLCLGTSEGTTVIPLRFLHGSAVWEVVRQLAPRAALEQGAQRRLPAYQTWAAERDALLGSSNEPRAVTDHWLIQLTGWAGLSVFLFGAIAEFGVGSPFTALGMLSAALLCMLVLLNWGITEFGVQGVERNTLFSGWSMRWDEVRFIEIDPSDFVMVLVGDNRQVVISGSRLWNGGKKAALAMLLLQAEQRHIPIRRTALALVKFSRRTGMKK